MKTSDFDYNLPFELIANKPAEKRDHSRLLVLDKKSGDIEHKIFYEILDYFEKGDVLVLNNSKVFPARLIGKKKGSGGRVEVFLHKQISRPPRSGSPDLGGLEMNTWECMIGGRNVQAGLEIEFGDNLNAVVVKNNENGTWFVNFNCNGNFMDIVEQIGKVPLPPYIKTDNRKQITDDRKSYQTVYASDDKLGSVAAPTAGLHFTEELLKKLKEKGVIVKYITLHVGLGTFAPVKVENIEEHKMHSELAEISSDVIEAIQKAKKEGGRVIGVGTTSVRTLESFADCINSPLKRQGELQSKRGCPGVGVPERSEGEGCKTVPQKHTPSASHPLLSRGNSFFIDTNIFIYPGYKFKVIDAMITNFHLPKSSLIMLVSALAGKKNIDKAYQEAIKEKYRFYSYGDAMYIC